MAPVFVSRPQILGLAENVCQEQTV